MTRVSRSGFTAAKRRVTVIAPSGFVVDQTDSVLVLRSDSRHLRLPLDSLLGHAATQRGGAVDSVSNLRLVRARPARVAGLIVAEIPGSDSISGVAIATVDSISRLGRAGLRPLDVIKRFNGRPIQTVNDLSRAASPLPSHAFAVDVIRHGKRVTVKVGARQLP